MARIATETAARTPTPATLAWLALLAAAGVTEGMVLTTAEVRAATLVTGTKVGVTVGVAVGLVTTAEVVGVTESKSVVSIAGVVMAKEEVATDPPPVTVRVPTLCPPCAHAWL